MFGSVSGERMVVFVLVSLSFATAGACACSRSDRRHTAAPSSAPATSLPSGAPSTDADVAAVTKGAPDGARAPAELPRGNPARLATGHDCGIWEDGSVWCWQGRCEPNSVCYPRKLQFEALPPGASVVDVFDSGGYPCVVLEDGEVLFAPSSAGKDTFCRQDVLGKYRVSTVMARTVHTCVLSKNGRVDCWNTPRPDVWRKSPDMVLERERRQVLKNAIQLDGLGTFCAVDTAGAVWCWGDFFEGERRNSAAVDLLRPRRVKGLPPASKVVVGSSHACALAKSSVYCWGNNSFGQLGIGRLPYPGHNPHEERKNPHSYARPLRVVELPPSAELVAAGDSTCAVSTEGESYCWGHNPMGEPQRYETHYVPSPRRVPTLPRVAQIVAFDVGVCALTANRETFCWGHLVGKGSSVAPVDWRGDLRR